MNKNTEFNLSEKDILAMHLEDCLRPFKTDDILSDPCFIDPCGTDVIIYAEIEVLPGILETLSKQGYWIGNLTEYLPDWYAFQVYGPDPPLNVIGG
jgi:hypothetical protein